MRFYIKTYGCQMNERDSDSAAALLQSEGHIPADSEEDADLVILNTCSVRDQAERKAIGKLGIMKRLKKENPNMIFGIMGCMAQSRGEELLRKIDHLDFSLGTDQIHRLPEIVDSILARRSKVLADERTGADTPGIDMHRVEPDGGHGFSAFVSIMRGCSRFCSYCIVPYARGPERSRDPASVVAEVRALAGRGVREVMLLGQNVAAFGLDNQAPARDDISPFADLLEQLNAINGLRRIRFTSPHPAYFNKKLVAAVTGLDKVCKSVHLPLQSGSDRILRKMNRPYTAQEYLEIVRALRAGSPEITFSTDVIVGFPTETEEDFQQTRNVMADVGFDNAYIFKYSPRQGTRSARWADDVPVEEKELRNQLLLKDLENSLRERNAALTGRIFEIMAEGPSKRNPARWQGRTDTFKNVVFTPDPADAIAPGDFRMVRIVRTTAMTLYGELI